MEYLLVSAGGRPMLDMCFLLSYVPHGFSGSPRLSNVVSLPGRLMESSGGEVDSTGLGVFQH